MSHLQDAEYGEYEDDEYYEDGDEYDDGYGYEDEESQYGSTLELPQIGASPQRSKAGQQPARARNSTDSPLPSMDVGKGALRARGGGG
eukprot:CAMPEP_0182912012 /NCGR_PEP_ID=MMETSP0034_2-20130328/37290_1 /TAXON_ID=156128 /ORGANISM="Nephroselmis pyriformis, Strain CCMP717" /LENGTH=87 /DNA_ID=CAMNT_0025048659 /DNA_START=74 /DNA_END=333 /DNA_ORIENTATION=-